MQNTYENSTCMLAEAGLNFALNLHIKYIQSRLLRPTGVRGSKDFGFRDSPQKKLHP